MSQSLILVLRFLALEACSQEVGGFCLEPWARTRTNWGLGKSSLEVGWFCHSLSLPIWNRVLGTECSQEAELGKGSPCPSWAQTSGDAHMPGTGLSWLQNAR